MAISMDKVSYCAHFFSSLSKIAFAAAISCLSASGYSANVNSNSNVNNSVALAPDDSWHIQIAPYVWALNMNGTEQIGTVRAHLDQSFSDILDHLNIAGMLWLDANKGRFGIFLNALYSSLSDNVSDGLGSVDTTVKFGLYSAGLSYQIYQHCFGGICSADSGSFTIDPFVGARYTVNDLSATLSIPSLGINIRDSDNQSWVDPIIGARLGLNFNRAWSFLFSGDVGGTNINNHFSYNLVGLFGYKPQTRFTNTTVYLGYRLLDQHYESGSGTNYFDWNMKIFGPLVGVAIAIK